MQKFTLTGILLFLSLSSTVFGQSARSYLVTNEGDTIYTAIKFTQRLSDNNREMFAFVKNRNVRYTPGDIKAFYNGLQEFETQYLGSTPIFLLRHTAGYANLYYCDEAVLADLIQNSPRLGDEIGYSLKEALSSAVNSVKTPDYFGGKIPVISGEGKALKIFDPHISKRKQELATYFYDFPGTESLLSHEKITPETYEQLIMAYNQWKPQAMARIAEQEKTANGF
ncbi:hypothetical protein QNI19_19410 [Cytophagaceae bacterium DM2B3-1]|uniref:GLPGLI family protein n=1 Tax=Xanthocytophaga flava TaxID=3048013 RepID=A0AAE3QVW9_9BACT|nr:hypothetical protein [Xanthocytophaga flavus]MDJ1472119.1 hypothetical protein [Xanthocytophaga flavus]MDJ1484378.1 hypothetical protein [Xanthocytophaga flavus]MDJ1495116.1 hypothetical protein [Xanthocytophaga flavus]